MLYTRGSGRVWRVSFVVVDVALLSDHDLAVSEAAPGPSPAWLPDPAGTTRRQEVGGRRRRRARGTIHLRRGSTGTSSNSSTAATGEAQPPRPTTTLLPGGGLQQGMTIAESICVIFIRCD